MFGIFKKKKRPVGPPQLLDIRNNPIGHGDRVKSHRYDLGECQLILEENHFFYQSTDPTKEKISFTKMVDAITGNQKVEKIDS